jgi:hypothetical protein
MKYLLITKSVKSLGPFPSWTTVEGVLKISIYWLGEYFCR